MKRKAQQRRIKAVLSPVKKEVAEMQCKEISNFEGIKSYLLDHLDAVHQRKHLQVMCLLAKAFKTVPGKLTFETHKIAGGKADWEVTVYLTLKGAKAAIVYFVMRPQEKSPKARFGQFLIARQGVEKSLQTLQLSSMQAKRRFDDMMGSLKRYSAVQSSAKRRKRTGLSIDLNARSRGYLCQRLVNELAATLTP